MRGVQWHEALEEASRLYFGEQDVEGMLHTLLPLHTKLNVSMQQSPDSETKSEKFFKMVRRRPPLLLCAPRHTPPCLLPSLLASFLAGYQCCTASALTENFWVRISGSSFS